MAAAGVTTAGESAAGRPGGDGDDKKPPLSLALLALAAGGKKKKPIERKPDKFYYQNFSVQSYFKVSRSVSLTDFARYIPDCMLFRLERKESSSILRNRSPPRKILDEDVTQSFVYLWT